MKRIKLAAWVLVLLCGLSTASSASAEEDAAVGCRACHKDLIEADKAKRYVHSPFLQGNCAVCHVVGGGPEPQGQKKVKIAAQEQLDKISWFREAHGVSEEHWIRIPAKKISGSLFYKAWDGQIRSSLLSLDLPELQALPTMEPDMTVPVIKDVRVADVRRGISTTVTIRWRTNEFTDSEVLYGADRLDSSSFDSKLRRQHEIILVGLDADRDYQFQVISRDLFGNRSESGKYFFTTDKTFIEQGGHHQVRRPEGEAIRVTSEAYRQGGHYLIVFRADRPISISLGVEQGSVVVPEVDKQEAQVAAAGTGHPLLKSQLDTNNNVCYECHSSFKGAYSHPVNVFPKAGMRIPPEYPLLPDGRISCMSCHSAHSSDLEYRLIKPRKSELCRGCHRDY